MGQSTYLTNQFLIAMPSLMDPNFYQSVTYICEHNENGAMGIIINQPVDLSVEELMEQMNLITEDPQLEFIPIYRGGPVDEEHGFVIHQPHGRWESSMPVSAEIAVTTSNDIVHAMAAGRGPERYLVALGYAGWGPGQLEQELLDNAWLNGPADPKIIFETPAEKRWEEAAALLGINIHQLTMDAGHA